MTEASGEYRFDIAATPPVMLAVIQATVLPTQIASSIPPMLETVHAWLRDSSARRVGQNYVVYDRFSGGGMRMQVGFPVAARFADNEKIKCVSLAAGKAAHTTHNGSYAGLFAAHSQLNSWCAREGLELGGISWEIYGDWQDDPSKLVTDIYLQLK